MTERPAVSRTPPRPLRRQLRQEVYYSCPICSNPLLTYHHIVPWRDEHHFRQQDMIALCYNHARMADSNAISRATLYNLKANPPKRRRVRDKFVIDDWSRFGIVLGGDMVWFEGCMTVLRVEGQPLLGFSRQFGRPALVVDLKDVNGRTLLKIDDNDWMVNVEDRWDCEVKGNQIYVRDRSRQYYVRYKVDAAKSEVAMSFRLHSHGQDIIADGTGLWLCGLNMAFSHFRFRNMPVAFDLFKGEDGRWKGKINAPDA